jgi:hypothetical protein
VIDALNPEYNIARQAGNTLGIARTPETRAKIAAKAKGRIWSDTAKAKLSATITGRKLSDGHRQKLIGNKHALGHKHTDEWKRANSKRHLGSKRPKDADHRAKISAALKGIVHSPEQRARQAAAQRGLKRGPYRKHISPAQQVLL